MNLRTENMHRFVFAYFPAINTEQFFIQNGMNNTWHTLYGRGIHGFIALVFNVLLSVCTSINCVEMYVCVCVYCLTVQSLYCYTGTE